MAKEYYIDIGSSTIKTYLFDGARLDLVDEFSTLFKDGFSKETGVAAEKLELLFAELSKTPVAATKTFATGIWREIPAAQLAHIKSRVPNFNVISHEDEARYLKRATEGLDFGGKKVLVINMGGKTTELVSFAPGAGAPMVQAIKVGVADMLDAFPQVNQPISGATLEEMTEFVSEKLKGVEIGAGYDFALFTGELRFEKLSGYPLSPNKMFSDANHPFQLSLDDFIAGTKRIFFDLTMDDLRALMPKNPNWMTGARPGAILPLAVFKRAGINVIIPSDVNLINGVL